MLFVGGEDFVASRLYVISEEGVFLFFFPFNLQGKRSRIRSYKRGSAFSLPFISLLNVCIFLSFFLAGGGEGEREDEKQKEE